MLSPFLLTETFYTNPSSWFLGTNTNPTIIALPDLHHHRGYYPSYGYFLLQSWVQTRVHPAISCPYNPSYNHHPNSHSHLHPFHCAGSGQCSWSLRRVGRHYNHDFAHRLWRLRTRKVRNGAWPSLSALHIHLWKERMEDRNCPGLRNGHLAVCLIFPQFYFDYDTWYGTRFFSGQMSYATAQNVSSGLEERCDEDLILQ